MKLPNMQKIKSSKAAQAVRKAANSYTAAKFVVCAIVWLIALIPTWIYIGIRWLVDPFGFWQELAIIILCMAVMGWIQVFALIFAVYITISTIIDEPY